LTEEFPTRRRVLFILSCGCDQLVLLRLPDDAHDAGATGSVFLGNISQRHSGNAITHESNAINAERSLAHVRPSILAPRSPALILSTMIGGDRQR
jgi:hypothetical protein